MYANTCKLERESQGRPTVQNNIYSVYRGSVYVYKFAMRVLSGHSHVHVATLGILWRIVMVYTINIYIDTINEIMNMIIYSLPELTRFNNTVN